MLIRSPLINVMVRAVERAGLGLRRDFGEAPMSGLTRKGTADFVTRADLRSEKGLVRELSRARPEFGILSEEMGETLGSDEKGRRFVIDPLDGTLNFLHGHGAFCISLALEEEGRVVAGVVHDPILNETFWAERDIGSFLGERRLSVRSPRSLSTSLLSTTLAFCKKAPNPRAHKRFVAQFSTLVQKSGGVRLTGSSALNLAYLAAGRLDGFWGEGLKLWDVAAGLLLVEMAGGLVFDFAGKDKTLVPGEVLATPRVIASAFTECLAETDAVSSERALDHIGPAVGGAALSATHDGSHRVGDGQDEH